MNNIIKKDILRILTKVIEGIKKKDVVLLSDTSNRINHNSSIFQDEDSITLAVVVYAISKLMESKGKVDIKILNLFKKSKSSLLTDDFESYRNSIKSIVNAISSTGKKMRDYVLHVYNRAEIKKGSKLFSNGISLPRAANLLNISQWELMEYIGKTNIPDMFERDKKIKSRLKYARSLFHIK